MADAAEVLEEPTVPARQPLQRQSAKRRIMRMLADGLAVSAAFFLTSIIRFEILDTTPAQTADYTVVTPIATPANVLLFWLYGLY